MPETSRPPAEGSTGGPNAIERLVSSTDRLIQSGQCPRCHEKLTPNAARCPTCKVRMQEIRAMAMQGQQPLPVRRKTPDELRTAKSGPLLLLLCAFAASVSAAGTVELAVQRFQGAGASSNANTQSMQELLVDARNVGLVACVLFGLSMVVLYRGRERHLAVLPLLGTITACAPAFLLMWVPLFYVDCFSSCAGPKLSGLLWPAFLLQVAASGLGIAATIRASSVSSLVSDT